MDFNLIFLNRYLNVKYNLNYCLIDEKKLLEKIKDENELLFDTLNFLYMLENEYILNIKNEKDFINTFYETFKQQNSDLILGWFLDIKPEVKVFKRYKVDLMIYDNLLLKKIAIEIKYPLNKRKYWKLRTLLNQTFYYQNFCDYLIVVIQKNKYIEDRINELYGIYNFLLENNKKIFFYFLK